MNPKTDDAHQRSVDLTLLAAFESHPNLVVVYRVGPKGLSPLGFNKALREEGGRLAPNLDFDGMNPKERETVVREALLGAEYQVHCESWFSEAVSKNRVVAREITNPLKRDHVLGIEIVPVSVGGQKVTHIYCLARDTSQNFEKNRVLIQQQSGLEQQVEHRTAALRAALMKAEAATQVKSDFLARIGHELRTPMHAILSFAALGKDPQILPPTGKLQGYFENIHRAGGQMLEMLSDLLDFSKLESRHMSFEFRPHRLRDICLDTIDALGELAEKRSMALVLRCPENLVAVVDAMRFSQVLRNLLSNAIKYGTPQTEIEIDLHTASNNLQLQVRDRGPGIPQGEEESIFEMFTQSTQTRHQNRGTGLGLAISREIAKAHGGQLIAQAREGGGSVFTMTLPLKEGG